MNQRRLINLFLASFSFLLGCTVTLFVLHATTLKPVIDFEQVPRLKLLVLVISAVKNHERRDAIRETWASVAARSREHVKVMFVLSRDKYLNSEKLIYDDMLEVDVPDEYRLLSQKLLESFDRVVRDNSFEYLLKCDDDSFVDLARVVGELKHAPANRFYWGYFTGNAKVKRAGKWKETNWIMCDLYLPFALGGGYVLSKDLVVFIVNNRHYLSLFVSEDVSVGMWLAPLNITRKHDRRFDTEYRSRGCHNEYLVTHKHRPETMRQYWLQINETGKMCKKEYQFAGSYEYNWMAKTSKCCVVNSSLFP